MNSTRKRAAMAGGLAAACLAAVAAGSLAVLGATAGSQGWATYVEAGLPVGGADADLAAMEAELGAIEAERDAFLEGIGVTPPGLAAEVAAEVRERAAPVLARYAAALEGGAAPGDGTLDALNAEYDAILAEFGAAPQALSAEQARAIAEYRDAEAERLDEIYGAHGMPGMPGVSDEDAAELARIDEEAEAVAARFGLAEPDLTLEQELALATRLAPLEQRYDELHAEIDALYEELDRLDRQNRAIAAASVAADVPQLTDGQWDEYMDAMRPLEMRAEEIYERIYSAQP